MKRKALFNSKDPMYEASSSSPTPHGSDYEGGTKRSKGSYYEVFLSFRGEDTRKAFTDYLYTSLVNAGIHVFKDDNELHVGEEIGPELLYSITQSMISIPIISENYPSSKWCLDELAHMLKCKRSRGQLVLPIFYKVKPSQLRHLTGQWRDAINAHRENLHEMDVKKWEKALAEVSSLKGWESEKIENGHEGALVQIVVGKVMSELKRLFQLNVPKQLVGIDGPVEEIMSWIHAKFNGTRIIGIYGMGGIGKTTLAKVLYNQLSSHFKHVSFVANIREASRRNGIECLQKQLIVDIIRSPWDVTNVDEGIEVIKSRFTSKKILILLDDLDNNTHLNDLIGDGTWFETGSIVIITTRNRSILDKARATLKYQLEELPSNQSLILFSKHAFRKDSPSSGYEVISHDVVSTTGGLPLALEVIGSFLYGKREEVWKDTLKKLKKVPNKTVQEKLKISYEALEKEEQEIFLDIACFFIESHKENPTYMWDASDFLPWRGIEVLSDMSLIKIDKNDIIMMHDQLRDLGREIVHLENPKEPEKRSRLWDYEEALDVIDGNKATRNIQALSLGNCGEGRTFTAKQFKEMTDLRFLQADGANFTGNFQSLLPKLRWLQWQHCPSDFATTNFHLKKLVILDLSNSEITEDWGGWVPLKEATELKVLNLWHCRSLKKTPDLSTFVKLEILNLRYCWNLEELHPSIGNLTLLIKLILAYTSIRKLPESIGNLQNLSILNIESTYVTELPYAIEMLAKLQILTAWSCLNLKRLPSTMYKLISLENLELSNCKKLRELPEPPSCLKDLVITYQGRYLPRLFLLTRLKRLFIHDCHGLECVPKLPIGLSELCIINCGKLKALTTNLSGLKHLRYFMIEECPSLERVPKLAIGLSKLRCFLIRGCSSLERVPKLPVGLRRLRISNCGKLKAANLSNLKYLQEFMIYGCPSLKRALKLPIGLPSLYIIGHGKLKAFTTNLSDLKHFKALYNDGCLSLKGQPKVLNFRRRQMKELEPAEISADP